MILDRGGAGAGVGTGHRALGLPSDAPLQFLLLLLATLVASIRWGYPIGFLLLGQPTGTVSPACDRAFSPSVWPTPWYRLPDLLAQLRLPAGACGPPTPPTPHSLLAVDSGLGAAAVILLAMGLYLLTPAWRRWSRGLVPFPTAQMPDLARELDELSRRAGVRVHFLLDLLDARQSGVAFGRAGRRFVLLRRGLLTLARRDPGGFRAVVAHELAHVRNRDLDILQFTVALWRAFAVLLASTALLYAVSNLLHHSRYALDVVYDMAWLALFVLLTRNWVLQSVELAADARVAAWPELREPLLRVLSALPPGRRLLDHPWRTHPGPATRSAVLRGTGSAVRGGAGIGFALGLAIPLTSIETTLQVQLAYVTGTNQGPGGIYEFTLLVLPAAALVAGCLVLIAWRSAVAASLGDQAVRPWRLSLGLGAGTVVALVLAQDKALHPVVLPRPDEIATFVAWALLAPVAWWAFVRWLVVTARAWLGVVGTSRTLLPVLAVHWLLATAVLCLTFPFFEELVQGAFIAQLNLPGSPLPARLAVMLVAFVGGQPWLVPLGLVVLAVTFLLVPRAWGAGGSRLLLRQAVRLLAAAGGLGAAAAVLWLVVRVVEPAVTRVGPPGTPDAVVLGVIPLLAAGVVAARARADGGAAGLCAAIIAGIVAMPVIVLGSYVEGCASVRGLGPCLAAVPVSRGLTDASLSFIADTLLLAGPVALAAARLGRRRRSPAVGLPATADVSQAS